MGAWVSDLAWICIQTLSVYVFISTCLRQWRTMNPGIQNWWHSHSTTSFLMSDLSVTESDTVFAKQGSVQVKHSHHYLWEKWQSPNFRYRGCCLPNGLCSLKGHIIFLHFPNWKMAVGTNTSGSLTAWEFRFLRKLMRLLKWHRAYPWEKRFRRAIPNLAMKFCICIRNDSVCITPSQPVCAIRLKQATLGEKERLKWKQFLL